MALGEPEELQKQLLTAGEIVLTTDAAVSVVKQALSGLPHITDLEFVQQEAGLTVVHIKSDLAELYELSRSISQQFSRQNLAIYEMSLKKGSLEDVFLELSDAKEKEDENS